MAAFMIIPSTCEYPCALSLLFGHEGTLLPSLTVGKGLKLHVALRLSATAKQLFASAVVRETATCVVAVA